MTSLIEPRNKSVHPTDRRAMVSADDPYGKSSEREHLGRWPDIQLVSPLFRPIRAQTVPANNRLNPTKSNSSMCSLSVLPLWGFRLRKKNRMAPATPAVGLRNHWATLCNRNFICAYKLIQKHLKKDDVSALIASTSNKFLTISRTHGQLRRPQEGVRIR
jgi:hypothetical protein